jgi:hypothetical protein
MRRLEHEEQAAGGRPRKTITYFESPWRMAGGEYYRFRLLSQRMATMNIPRMIKTRVQLHHRASSPWSRKACWDLAMLD